MSGTTTRALRAAAMLRRAADRAFSLLAPPFCRHCRSPLWDHDQPFLCRKCAADVIWAGRNACRTCGFPLGPHLPPQPDCRECRDKRLNLSATAAVTRYAKGARSLVLAFKFGGEMELARALGSLMAHRLRDADFPAPDVVAAAASHSMRSRRRGFDPAVLLADRVAAEAGLAAETRLLTRMRDTKPQSTLLREERLHNMAHAFRANRRLDGATVLLVDDVMTTGATLADCARACRDAGASQVYGLVFAR